MTDDDYTAPLTSLLDRRGNPSPMNSILTPVPASVLTRADQAMDRINRLATALEKAADEIEKQLAVLKGRL